MGQAEIAAVTAAGGAALALIAVAWALALHARLTRGAEAAGRRADTAERARDRRDAAFAAFEVLALSIDREGRATGLIGDEAAIRLALDALAPPGADGAGASDPARSLIGALRLRHGDSVAALARDGAPFDRQADGWRVSGRVAGDGAWLRLAPAPPAADAEQAPRAIAGAAPQPIWLADGAGRMIWANRAWLDEVRAPDLARALTAQASFDRGADALVIEAARSGRRQEGFRWTTGERRRRAWRIVAQPLEDGSGHVAAFAVDATEAEETRDLLRRHVEAHDETLDHLADAVAIFGADGRLTFRNTAFQQLFDLDPGWLDERPTHAELLDRLRQRRLLPETVDYARWKADELAFYGATEAAPDDSWSLPDGRTLRVVRQPHPLGGVLLLFSDMTDELRLRSRYNAQIQVQTATLDKLNDAVAVFGSDGRLRLHNDAFEGFWRLSADALRQAGHFDAVADLCKAVLPDPALWLGLKARVADPDPESRVPISGEGRAADGRIAAWQTRPLPDGATLVAFSDVTARRQLERALAQREAALAESQVLKREFVGNVSYELRTPLTTIVGYSELLEALGDLPERSRQHAGAIRVAASQLTRSIDDVLDMAEIDAGEMALSLHDVAVCDLLAEAAEGVRARVLARGADLEVDCPADLGLIRADARRIAQAVDHLLDNAVRAVGQEGRVRLQAEAGSAEVRIRVSDTGRGIPYHLQAHVFDRYVRRDRGGPGVGLALVKALVELHGGWAEVESEPGAGSTFILHLPKSASDDRTPELGLR